MISLLIFHKCFMFKWFVKHQDNKCPIVPSNDQSYQTDHKIWTRVFLTHNWIFIWCKGQIFTRQDYKRKYSLVDAHLIATTLPVPGQHYKLYIVTFLPRYAWAYERYTNQCIIWYVLNPPSCTTLQKIHWFMLLSHAQACLGMKVSKTHV